MNEEMLLGRCKRWGGFSRRRDANRAMSATLRALREGLFDDEVQAIARELPQRLARIVADGAHGGRLTLPQFYGQVASYENVAPGPAVEHAQAACEALALLLPEPSLTRLRKALPALAELFVRREREPERGPEV